MLSPVDCCTPTAAVVLMGCRSCISETYRAGSAADGQALCVCPLCVCAQESQIAVASWPLIVSITSTQASDNRLTPKHLWLVLYPIFPTFLLLASPSGCRRVVSVFLSFCILSSLFVFRALLGRFVVLAPSHQRQEKTVTTGRETERTKQKKRGRSRCISCPHCLLPVRFTGWVLANSSHQNTLPAVFWRALNASDHALWP